MQGNLHQTSSRLQIFRSKKLRQQFCLVLLHITANFLRNRFCYVPVIKGIQQNRKNEIALLTYMMFLCLASFTKSSVGSSTFFFLGAVTILTSVFMFLADMLSSSEFSLLIESSFLITRFGFSVLLFSFLLGLSSSLYQRKLTTCRHVHEGTLQLENQV